jgi:membrane associated rhomboid family serine protease
MFNIPGVILGSIALIIGIHFSINFLSERGYIDILFGYGFVPAAWTIWMSPDALTRVLEEAAQARGGSGIGLAIARFALIDVESGPWTLLSYALLHGSWSHVLLNAFWLAAFGTPVARRLGTGRFLLLCVVTALGGAAAHWITHLYDVTPMIGASGIVSGMMGAAAWFVFASHGGGRGGLIDRYAHLKPRQTLASMITNRQLLIFFGIWFALNFLFGVAAGPLGIVDGGIAWQAHIGGFLTGLAGFPLLDPAPRHWAG